MDDCILSKLNEITLLLERSCRQQQEILSRLNALEGSSASFAPQEPFISVSEPMEIPEIPSIEFPSRPEDTLTCPKCHMMQSSSHNACSHCGVPFIFLSKTSNES